MRPSQLRSDLKVRERAREIVAFQRDPERPGRPVFSTILGAALALASFAAAAYVAYLTWYQASLSSDTGFFWLGIIFLAHAAGVAVFSYAYESYDLGKALRLALIILGCAVATIVVIVGVFAVLAALRHGDFDAAGDAAKGLRKLGKAAVDLIADADPGPGGGTAAGTFGMPPPRSAGSLSTPPPSSDEFEAHGHMQTEAELDALHAGIIRPI